jgi:hypothetical protein
LTRGLAGSGESSSDDEEAGSLDEEWLTGTDVRAAEEADALAEWGAGAMAANPAEPIPVVEETTARLALVDLGAGCFPSNFSFISKLFMWTSARAAQRP